MENHGKMIFWGEQKRKKCLFLLYVSLSNTMFVTRVTVVQEVNRANRVPLGER